MILTHGMTNTALRSTSGVDLVHEFQVHLVGSGRRPGTTASSYARVVRQYLAQLHEHVDSATRGDIESFLAGDLTRAGGPSKAAWNIRLAAVRAFYRWLIASGYAATNPTNGVLQHRLPPRDAVPPTMDEYLAMVEAARAHGPKLTRSRNEAIVEVFFNTAMRISELVSLDLEQLDLQNHFFTNVVTKGDKREVKHMNDLAAAALERYLVDRVYLASDGVGALWVSNRGTRISTRAVADVIATCARRAGIGRAIHPHLMRYAAASELAKQNVPVPDIQAVCGHATIATTQRYIRLGDGRRQAALGQLQAAVEKRREALRGDAMKNCQ